MNVVELNSSKIYCTKIFGYVQAISVNRFHLTYTFLHRMIVHQTNHFSFQARHSRGRCVGPPKLNYTHNTNRITGVHIHIIPISIY